MKIYIVSYDSGSYIHPETYVNSVWSTEELANKRKAELDKIHNYVANPFQYTDILKINQLLLSKGVKCHDEDYDFEYIRAMSEYLEEDFDIVKEKYKQYQQYKENLYNDYFVCYVDEYEVDEETKEIDNDNHCDDIIDLRNALS